MSAQLETLAKQMAVIKVGPAGNDSERLIYWEYHKPNYSAIKNIKVNYNESLITSLSFKDSEGNWMTAGRDDGTSEEIESDGDFTKISGTIAEYKEQEVIASLSLWSGEQQYGPYGNTNGTSFALEGPSIVGFFGSIGSHGIYALGIYVTADP